MPDMRDAQRDYVLRTVEERGIRLVRLWFTDVLGNLKSFIASMIQTTFPGLTSSPTFTNIGDSGFGVR